MFWFSLQRLSEIFLILRRTEREMIKNVYWSSIKYLLFLRYFNYTSFTSTDFRKVFIYKNFMKIGLVGAGLFHADGRTYMTKVIVAFRNFANAPKSEFFLPFLKCCTLLRKSTYCSHIANECINMQIRRKIFTRHREVGMKVKFLGLS